MANDIKSQAAFVLTPDQKSLIQQLIEASYKHEWDIYSQVESNPIVSSLKIEINEDFMNIGDSSYETTLAYSEISIYERNRDPFICHYYLGTVCIYGELNAMLYSYENQEDLSSIYEIFETFNQYIMSQNKYASDYWGHLEEFGVKLKKKEIVQQYVASATSVAQYLLKYEPKGSLERQEFGKQFELAVQQTCWQWYDIAWSKLNAFEDVKKQEECPKCHQDIMDDSFSKCGYCQQRWHKSCSQLMSHTFPDDECDAYDDDYESSLICPKCAKKQIIEYVKSGCAEAFREEAGMIAIKMFDAGMWGLNPRTLYKEVFPNHYISAKPDLRHLGQYYEFKTYPPNDFAITQCKVFSWVLGCPVILLGWDSTCKKVDVLAVSGSDLNFQSLQESDIFKPSVIYEDRILHS